MMKNILTVLVLILLYQMNLNAQNFELGIKTGFGIANVHLINIDNNENISEISPVFSYSANAVLSYKSNGFWGFSIEPGIIKKGWIYNKTYIGTDIKIKANYIQLPILSDFYLSNKLSFSIGPEMDYLLNAKSISEDGSYTITDVFRKFELAGVVGITYNIVNNLDIGIRYSLGVTELSDNIFWTLDEFGENHVVIKDYNQYFQITIKMKLKNLR